MDELTEYQVRLPVSGSNPKTDHVFHSFVYMLPTEYNIAPPLREFLMF